MRTLILNNNWGNWKFGDTDAVMTFTPKTDYITPHYNGNVLTFKIAQANGQKNGDYVASAPGHVAANGRDVELDTSDLAQLEPDTYAVELWITDGVTKKTQVYPSESYCFFTIDQNTMGVTDISNIPTKTIQAVYADLLQKIDAFKTGVPGKDGISPKLKVGTVAKLAPDAQPIVTLTPDTTDKTGATVILDLGIPQGFEGEPGKDAVQPKFNISVTTLEAGKDASATVTASADLATYNVVIGIPKGKDGANGITPTIGANGNWFLGDKDTGLPSRGPQGLPGKDGKTPQIDAKTGHWMLGNLDTGVTAKGDKGDTGSVDNAGLTNAPAFQALQAQVNNGAVGTNLASGTSPEDQSVGNASQTAGWLTPTIATLDNPQAGQQYTISVNVKPNGSSWSISVWDGTSSTQRATWLFGEAAKSAQEQKHVLTFTWPSTKNKYMIVQLVNNNDGGQVTWNSVMLEEGTVAHTWSPAPTDILTQSDYAKIKAAIVALGGSLS